MYNFTNMRRFKWQETSGAFIDSKEDNILMKKMDSLRLSPLLPFPSGMSHYTRAWSVATLSQSQTDGNLKKEVYS